MNTKVISKVKLLDKWECVVEYWHECKCTSKKEKVYLHSESKPLDKDVITEFRKLDLVI